MIRELSLDEVDPIELGFTKISFVPPEQGGPVVSYVRTSRCFYRHEFYGPEGHPTLPGAPTEAVYNSDEELDRVEWLRDVKVRHREFGPAIIRYRADGAIRRETYYRGGLRTNDHGPADVLFHLGGSRTENYFLDNRLLPKTEHDVFREAIEAGAPREWAFAYLEGARSSS